MDIKSIKNLYVNAEIYSNKLQFIEKYFDKKSNATVLDVGFYGQGFSIDQPMWPHNIIRSKVKRCVGIDIAPEVEGLERSELIVHKMNAEDFSLDEKFDVIYSGDNIEHLSNPGKFLECCVKHLAVGGEIVVSTPNPYFLTSILQKLTYRHEPSVHPEHTCFYNVPTFSELVSRYGLRIKRLGLIKRLDTPCKPGILMRFAHGIHQFVSFFTNKYSETFVFVLAPKN